MSEFFHRTFMADLQKQIGEQLKAECYRERLIRSIADVCQSLIDEKHCVAILWQCACGCEWHSSLCAGTFFQMATCPKCSNTPIAWQCVMSSWRERTAASNPMAQQNMKEVAK